MKPVEIKALLPEIEFSNRQNILLGLEHPVVQTRLEVVFFGINKGLAVENFSVKNLHIFIAQDTKKEFTLFLIPLP